MVVRSFCVRRCLWWVLQTNCIDVDAVNQALGTNAIPDLHIKRDWLNHHFPFLAATTAKQTANRLGLRHFDGSSKSSGCDGRKSIILHNTSQTFGRKAHPRSIVYIFTKTFGYEDNFCFCVKQIPRGILSSALAAANRADIFTEFLELLDPTHQKLFGILCWTLLWLYSLWSWYYWPRWSRIAQFRWSGTSPEKGEERIQSWHSPKSWKVY